MEKSIGKLICFVLRHKPEVIDVKIDKNGWADIDELIAKIKEYKQKEITLQDLEVMVATDDKTSTLLILKLYNSYREILIKSRRRNEQYFRIGIDDNAELIKISDKYVKFLGLTRY